MSDSTWPDRSTVEQIDADESGFNPGHSSGITGVYDDSWSPYPGFLNDNDKKNAYSSDEISEGYAEILRSEYDDWKDRFKPFEDEQRNLVLDSTKRNRLRRNALNYVNQGVGSALGQTRANMKMNDRKFGRALSADEKQSRQRRLGNQAALSLAAGRTRMRQTLNDRDLAMLSGGIG